MRTFTALTATAREDALSLRRAIDRFRRLVPDGTDPDLAAAIHASASAGVILDAARTSASLPLISPAVAEGWYRLARAQARAAGRPLPERRPMCYFDSRHGMAVTDVTWKHWDGRTTMVIDLCAGCWRLLELHGQQPYMRMVEDEPGSWVAYINARTAPEYWAAFYPASPESGQGLGVGEDGLPG